MRVWQILFRDAVSFTAKRKKKKNNIKKSVSLLTTHYTYTFSFTSIFCYLKDPTT